MKRSFRLPHFAIALASLAATPVLAQTVVPTAPFDSVELEGGGHVTVKYGAAQRVRLIKGSTEFTRIAVEDKGKLRIEACRNDCPRHYDLDVEIVTPRIDALAISGGGHIEAVPGFRPPRKLALAIDGGGTIDARALDTAKATVAVDGGGHIDLRVEEKLTAAISGGGKIKYWGHPNVTQAIDGGGSVERGD
jgi:hypothetical protein